MRFPFGLKNGEHDWAFSWFCFRIIPEENFRNSPRPVPREYSPAALNTYVDTKKQERKRGGNLTFLYLLMYSASKTNSDITTNIITGHFPIINSIHYACI